MSDQKIDLQEEVLDLTQKLIEAEKENNRLNQSLTKSNNLIVQEREMSNSLKNQLTIIERFPDLEEKRMRLQYELELAKQFSISKAFGNYTPEQIYVMMKAGQEMGMKDIEALQTLYIVNGKIKFYGDKMIGHVLKSGYKVEYLNETDKSVDVRVYNDLDFDITEKANVSDATLKNSKALQFAPKQKLRFHGFRMIASFHLPHLFGSTSDEFTSDFIEFENVKEDEPKKINKFKTDEQNNELAEIEELINSIETVEELKEYRDKNKAMLSKNIGLVNILAARMKELSKMVENE